MATKVPEIVEALKIYQHSHEILNDKVIRRFMLQDRGSREESVWRQRLRVLVYTIPFLLSRFTLFLVPLEKMLSELIGRGTARTHQAQILYDEYIKILALLEKPLIDDKAVFEKLNDIVANTHAVLEKLWEPPFLYAGESKVLKPLAFNALGYLINLIVMKEKRKEMLVISSKHIAALNHYPDFINNELKQFIIDQVKTSNNSEYSPAAFFSSPHGVPEFEILRGYYHSHELFNDKFSRRFKNRSKDASEESTLRHCIRSLVYFVPYVVSCFTLFLTPLEKALSEVMGRGTARSHQAQHLYNNCIKIQKLLEETPISENKVSNCFFAIMDDIKEVLSEVPMGGHSTVLKPLAFEALDYVINLIHKKESEKIISSKVSSDISTKLNDSNINPYLKEFMLPKFPNLSQNETSLGHPSAQAS